MNNWPKIKKNCDQSWNSTYFAPKLYYICTFFATTKKININVESLYFPTFSAKCHMYKVETRDGHGKLRNGPGKLIEKLRKKHLWEPCRAEVRLMSS